MMLRWQYHVRGRSGCKNGLEAAMVDADAAVLASVEHDVLRVEVLEMSLFKAMAALRTPARDEAHDADRLRAELAKLEAEITRLASAIATGGDMRALLEAMRQREARRASLVAQIHALDRQAAQRSDAGAVESALDKMRSALADWRATLRAEVGPARQALRPLLAGRLAFTPRQDADGRRYYSFEGPGTISPIITGVLPKAFGARP